MTVFEDYILSTANIRSIDFQAGSMILINKPLGWTSFDVVNKLRFALKHSLGLKKIKVGHAGTLDPLATGLLIVCTGKMTKTIDFIQAESKVYSGHFVLGATTPTYDAEVAPTEYFATEHINNPLLEEVRNSFIGDQMQVPPVYSAVKIDGSKAYSLARKGKEDIELRSRPIKIFDFILHNDDLSNLRFTLHCSKGTYVRSLAHDFGTRCRSGAYLGSLNREYIGNFALSDALDLQEAVTLIQHLKA
jgi:tRNA pseudouridine55 synthase